MVSTEDRKFVLVAHALQVLEFSKFHKKTHKTFVSFYIS
jgi:hypothetical protein